MKSATIHYFSGTGNTFRVASIIRQRLEDNDYSVRLRNIENGYGAGDSDLDVFAFPVYAYDVPEIMLRYLRSLPPVQKRSAAVIAVHGMLWQRPIVPGDGGDPGWSFEHARRILSRKGYDVDYTMAVGYPHSISMLLSAPSPGEITKIRVASDKRVSDLASKILSNTKSLQKCGLFPIAYSMFPGFLFGIFGRIGLGKLFVADRSCTKCGNCIASCPAGAIHLSLGRPRWNWNCQGCQRCINLCPQRAIQASLPRFFAVFGGLIVPWNTLAYMLLPAGLFTSPGGLAGGALDIAVWLLFYAAFLYVIDKLVFVLESIPIVGKVMSLNLSSSNRRYLDPLYRAVIKKEAPLEAKTPK